jgi:hypothetical protein
LESPLLLFLPTKGRKSSQRSQRLSTRIQREPRGRQAALVKSVARAKKPVPIATPRRGEAALAVYVLINELGLMDTMTEADEEAAIEAQLSSPGGASN